MARPTLTITGVRELRNQLRRLAAEAPRIVAPAIREGLEVLRSKAAAEAPTGETGQLSGGMTIVEHPTRAGRVSAEATTSGADYAGHVDLGTAHMESDDFIQRTFDESGGKAADVAASRILDAIERSLG